MIQFNTISKIAVISFLAAFSNGIAQDNTSIDDIRLKNSTTAEVSYSNGQKLLLDFYGDNIVRMFHDNSGKGMRDPEAKPEAIILDANPRTKINGLKVFNNEQEVGVGTDKIKILFDRKQALFKIVDVTYNHTVVEEIAPYKLNQNKTSITLKQSPDEFFYGGGVQNGRFSHKGKIISIENQNSWTDGGVASPTPFYWSTNGYGMMWHTFRKGKYDFGSTDKNLINIQHDTNYLDVFFMVDQKPENLLKDFYQLTGKPVLLPKFAFYEGHLNAYNRDFWKEDKGGIKFEDGKTYKESQKDNGGIKESLNGEKNNYQFSARAVIDRYKANDLPLGWILPNDGYGAGYGQTETLDGNIANLKNFGDYARKNGVEIGLWTQSDLHPKDGVSALLQRDIIKEVRDAGVRVLKTDVAWVGAGYSFGLNGVTDVGQIMPKYGNNARPFIISLDGWAGTQRYAGVWSGDQTGGNWEYIRFHIPTYIGSGLSGQPNITSDMDGIFGGKNFVVNTRDFQWKTFTPMQLNMDGWGSNEKYPMALGEPATSINRNYLKFKSELLPYAYSIAKEAVDGLPMIRAMFTETKNNFTLSKATQYQYMFGPYFLVAPIYQNTKADKAGNDIRNNIYLPEGQWIDYFTGEVYKGGRIINGFEAPIWKLPLFVKPGAIIPMTNPNNNVHEIDKGKRIYEVYPLVKNSFTEYDDDGTTQDYVTGKGVKTIIETDFKNNLATITVNPTTGNFDGFQKVKSTEFRINVTDKPSKIKVKIGSKSVRLKEVNSFNDFDAGQNVFYYNPNPEFNRFSTKGSEFSNVKITRNPQILVKLEPIDITTKTISLKLKNYHFEDSDHLLTKTGALKAPLNVKIEDKNAAPFSLTPSWDKDPNADYYEIEANDVVYSTIKNENFILDDLSPDTSYPMKIRAVNKSGVSPWVPFEGKTKANPLLWAIKNLSAESTAPVQADYDISALVDGQDFTEWFSDWDKKVDQFEVVIDLKSYNQLDKLWYLLRSSGRNGKFLKGKIYYSTDKTNWKDAGDYNWEPNIDTKIFEFKDKPSARYVKILVAEHLGNFGSGREVYIFKVPNSESFYPGDLNNDKKIDNNDLTSYMNYTGLRKGDADFEGYISNGDLNKNGLIDAYDITTVATQLNGGIEAGKKDKVQGKISIETDKKHYNAGENVEITVKGIDMKDVNALSFAIPYSATDYEFVAVKPLATVKMENFTNDRLHTNGKKVLYPTFVNIGDAQTLNGNSELFKIILKSKKSQDFKLKTEDGLLVDKNLGTSIF